MFKVECDLCRTNSWSLDSTETKIKPDFGSGGVVCFHTPEGWLVRTTADYPAHSKDIYRGQGQSTYVVICKECLELESKEEPEDDN